MFAHEDEKHERHSKGKTYYNKKSIPGQKGRRDGRMKEREKGRMEEWKKGVAMVNSGVGMVK